MTCKAVFFLFFLPCENCKERKITVSCTWWHMGICKSDSLSRNSFAPCVQFFVFVMAYGYIHGSGNTANPHTHCLPLSKLYYRVRMLVGYFSAQQLETPVVAIFASSEVWSLVLPDSTGGCQSTLVDELGISPSRYHHTMVHIAITRGWTIDP